MKRLASALSLIATAFAVSAASPAFAAIISTDFSGVLTSAVNNSYDDPSIPSSDFFQVGQAFSGNFIYDTAVPGSLAEGNAFFELQAFNIMIGGRDFSDRFIPREIFRSPDGDVTFLSGGASQGGSTSIVTTLTSSFQNYPTPGELNGKAATFSFSDFTPLGGIVAGQALLSSNGFVQPVPEASSWAMMILGVGFIGFAVRRGKVANTPAASLA